MNSLSKYPLHDNVEETSKLNTQSENGVLKILTIIRVLILIIHQLVLIFYQKTYVINPKKNSSILIGWYTFQVLTLHLSMNGYDMLILYDLRDSDEHSEQKPLDIMAY